MSSPRQRLPGGRRDRFARPRARVVAVLPTLLTLGNAVCGFGAISYAARWSGADTEYSLFVASCLLFLAMGFDALDGSTARWANRVSRFGAQLDSLCDAISFGAAPALLMLQFSLSSAYPSRLLWMVAALYVVCAVLRLARFNAEAGDESDRTFVGLPSPAAAGTVAAVPFMVYGLKRLDLTDQDVLWGGFARWFDWAAVGLLPVVTFAAAWLMVSRVPYVHMVHLTRRRKSGQYLIPIVFAAAVVMVVPQVSVPLLFWWYTFAPPVRVAWGKYVAKTGVTQQPDDPAADPPRPDAA
jgi:CDP-diacylglycerol--serine O-phosphatidyltransferase